VEIQSLASRIKLLLMDVDGVLTDGRIYNVPGPDGKMAETKGFNAQDGIALQWLTEKIPILEEILQKAQGGSGEVAYIGDDLTDVTIMRRVGLAVAPANAREEVKGAAHYVTLAPGGDGAVREAIEVILKAQELWEKILKHYEIGG
jgi:3-deoxy-D-manno-octulosonate 8-phosphate phosphatase (KDO 8-P phosphatase)